MFFQKEHTWRPFLVLPINFRTTRFFQVKEFYTEISGMARKGGLGSCLTGLTQYTPLIGGCTKVTFYDMLVDQLHYFNHGDSSKVATRII